MDFLGNDTTKDFDGTLDGNLNVNGDAEITGDLKVDGTIEANEIVGDISTSDAIITLALDNPADIKNMGYLTEFNDGADKYSGILRNHVDKKHYLLEDVAPKPTEGDLNIASANRGELVVESIEGKELKTGFWSIEEDTGELVMKNSGIERFRIDDSNGELTLKAGINFTGGTPYQLPATASGALDGDVLKYNSATGNLEFKDIAPTGESTWGTYNSTAVLTKTDSTALVWNTIAENDGASSSYGTLQIPSLSKGLIRGYTFEIYTDGTAVFLSPTQTMRYRALLDSNSSQLFQTQVNGGGIGNQNWKLRVIVKVTNVIGNNYNINWTSRLTVKDQAFEDSGSLLSVNGLIDQPFTCQVQFGETQGAGFSWVRRPFYQNNIYGAKIVADGAFSPFDQNLNTTSDVQFKSIKLVDGGDEWILSQTGSNLIWDINSSNTSWRINNASNDYYRSLNNPGGIQINYFRSRGLVSAPTALLSNDTISILYMSGYDGSQYISGATIETYTNENWSPTNRGTRMRFKATPTGQNAKINYLTLLDDQVQLGTYIVDGYSLPITRGLNGQILKLNGSDLEWADDGGSSGEFDKITIDNAVNADIDFKINGVLTNTITSNASGLLFKDGSGTDLLNVSNFGFVQAEGSFVVKGEIATIGTDSGSLGLFRSNVANESALLFSGGGDSIYTGRKAGSEDYTIWNNDLAQDLLSITHDTKETTTHGLLKADAGLEVDNGDAVVKDGNCLMIGDTSDVSTNKCVKIILTAGEAISPGYICKIVNVGGVAKVQTIKAGDADSVAVIGISASSALLDEDVKICIGGIFDVVVENGVTIVPGDLLEKSDTVGQDGRAFNPPASVGTFGVALTQGTGDVGGTVTVRGIYKKNESF